MKVCMIGSGNVATALSKLFVENGISISSVYSRNIKHAQELAGKINSIAVDGLSKLNDAELIVVAVDDEAINKVVSELNNKNAIVVHCSGSVEMQILKPTGKNFGVLYPLQSFSKDSTFVPKFPFIINGSNDLVKLELKKLCANLHHECFEMDDDQRSRIHLAAVFLNNFSNHVITIADSWLNENKLPTTLLLPLLETTFQKIRTKGAEASQTGPAIRNDVHVIEKHLQLLSQHPDWQKIYLALSNSIRNYYHS